MSSLAVVFPLLSLIVLSLFAMFYLGMRSGWFGLSREEMEYNRKILRQQKRKLHDKKRAMKQLKFSD